MSNKADEHDRRVVIKEIEKEFGVTLSPIGSRRKYLKDQNGKRYLILVGREDWHGIPHEIISDAVHSQVNPVFVVAQIGLKNIKIYTGSLSKLLSCQHLFKKNSKQLFLNLYSVDDLLYAKEVPNYFLVKLATIPYDDAEKESDKRLRSVEEMVSNMSSEDIRSLLHSLDVCK